MTLADELNAVGAETGVENGRLYLTDRKGNELTHTATHRVLQTNAGPDIRLAKDGVSGFTLYATDADGRPATATYDDYRWS